MDIFGHLFIVIASCNTYNHIVATCDTELEALEICDKFIARKHKERILRKSWRGSQWKAYVVKKSAAFVEPTLGRKTEESLRVWLSTINMEHKYEELLPSCLKKEHVNALARKRYHKDPVTAKLKEYQRREKRTQKSQGGTEDTSSQKQEV